MDKIGILWCMFGVGVVLRALYLAVIFKRSITVPLKVFLKSFLTQNITTDIFYCRNFQEIFWTKRNHFNYLGINSALKEQERGCRALFPLVLYAIHLDLAWVLGRCRGSNWGLCLSFLLTSGKNPRQKSAAVNSNKYSSFDNAIEHLSFLKM